MFETKSIRETCALLACNTDRGLTGEEAELRLRNNGPNELREAPGKGRTAAFLEQLNDPLIYVLLAAAVISLLLKETYDAVIIGTVICVNAAVGLIQEGKAQKALDSLKQLTSPQAYVIRDGEVREIPAARLVPGDLVCLEAGCRVPADLRLTRTNGLKVEESALTGESLPVEKNASHVVQGERGVLAENRNMAYMSTIVTGGRGEGLVTACGMETQIGKIASLVTRTPREITPLQKRLGDLGRVLSLLSLLLCGSLVLISLFQKRNVAQMLITAITLAVAAVPEGLPAVVTICLAMSVTRMVKAHTIVRKLPSVETLGAVSVVCSDKTGTLTMNRMKAESCFLNQRLLPADRLGETEHTEFLRGMTLCNDAVISGRDRIGDPTELALLDLAARYGIRREEEEKMRPRCGEIAFDSARRRMSTFHRYGPGGITYGITYVKGAPDVILERCTGILLYGRQTAITALHRRQIEAALTQMSGQALRTLAVALREGGNGPQEEGLVFVGMVGMRDPARPEAAGAVEKFRRAGVSTVMITGDHADTALAIARELGIAQSREQCLTDDEISRLTDEQLIRKLERVRVFARVSPESKVRIVKGFRAAGKIVAMTGDGVNDAPSLRAADIGIAMGQNGTDVAKQASELILTDDNFATIERAIEEGRGVYENIRKSVIFLLSSNLGEIMTMFLAVLTGLASPLKPGHILWINLITDSLPALALGADRNDTEGLMSRPPRNPEESLFAQGGLTCTCFYGLLIALISLAAFFTLPLAFMKQRGLPFTLNSFSAVLSSPVLLGRSQTYAFTVLGMSQLFHAVGMRDVHRSVFRMRHLENRLMIAACALGFLLQFAVTEIPFLTAVFGTAHLSLREWLRLGLLSSFPLLAHELLVLLNRFQKDR